MKRSNDKEMDLLLGRLARREGHGVSLSPMMEKEDQESGLKPLDGSHPDADELNAYAENALRPAARARYSAHLADCERCRRMVTTLALAGGVAGQLERAAVRVDASQGGSWWQRIAALFALPVVRYGVPALALTTVIAVVFLATRQQPGNETPLVARNEKQQQPVSATTAPDAQVEENHAGSTETETATTANANQSAGTAGRENVNSAQPLSGARGEPDADAATGGATEKRGAAQGNTNSSVAVSPPLATPVEPGTTKPVDSLADQRQQEEQSRRAEQASGSGYNASAPSSAAAAPPTPKSTDPFGDNRSIAGGTVASDQPAQPRRESPARVGVGPSDQDNYALKNKAEAKDAPATSSARRRVTARADAQSSAVGGRASADESAVEKRTVAGRTFRRQGGAWVDTAYNSSRATINVARGSEQYRALVADEPSIRTISEQLGGEVVIVWKGRAYRIR